MANKPHRSHNDRSHSDRSHNNQPHTDRPYSDRSHNNQPHTDRPDSDRSHSDQPHTDRPDSDRSHNNQPDTDRPDTDRSHNNQPDTDCPDTDRSHSDQPHTDRPDSDRSPGDLVLTQPMGSEDRPVDCLVVGAGICGLVMAQALAQGGSRVMVLDKGRGLGGRLATRRLVDPQGGEVAVDYGMPSFQGMADPLDALDPFDSWLEDWIAQGTIVPWRQLGTPAQTHYRGVPHNRAIAKTLSQALLAQGVQIHSQTQAVAVEFLGRDQGWVVVTAAGDRWRGLRLVLTAPVPQSLELLRRGGVSLPPDMADRLGQVTYDPGVVVLGLMDREDDRVSEGVDRRGDLGLVEVGGEPLGRILWTPGSGDSRWQGVTLYGGAQYSQGAWEEEPGTIVATLEAAAAPWVPVPLVAPQVHRWRYSQPQQVYGDICAVVPELGLTLAGDAFQPADEATGRSSLAAAVVSGLAAAQWIGATGG